MKKTGVYWIKYSKKDVWRLLELDSDGDWCVPGTTIIEEDPEIIGPFLCKSSYDWENPPTFERVRNKEKKWKYTNFIR